MSRRWGAIATWLRLMALACLATILTVACGSLQRQADQPYSQVGDPNVWVVATEPAFAPFTFLDADGNLQGFDVELMGQVCRRLGLELDFVSVPFDGILPMLEAGTVDAGISAITITPERLQLINFSRPYFHSGLGIAVRSDNQEIQSLADLAGHKIAAKLGTTGADLANDIPDGQVVLFDATDLALQDLANGNVDAVINDAPATLGMIAQGTATNIKLVGDLLTEEWYGIGLPPDSPNRPFVDEALSAIIADGTYDQIYRQWFGQAPPPPDALQLPTSLNFRPIATSS